jgi:8-oxo-dGTP pyrophosphatase MutT (NUDIX family)
MIENGTSLNSNSLLEKLTRQLMLHPWDYAKAAVAIFIKPSKLDLELFFVKRAEVDDDPWSGDMAFPGGKKNPQDATLVDTAIREVLEETNIDLTDKEALGFMEPIYSSVQQNLAVQPVIYIFENYPKVELNYELTKYIWAPLSEIKNGKTNAIIKGWDGPVYQIQGETIWGLTYRMLEKLLELLE